VNKVENDLNEHRAEKKDSISDADVTDITEAPPPSLLQVRYMYNVFTF